MMTYGELRRRLNEMPLSADRDPVMFLDTDTAQLLEIKEVEYEDTRYDEGCRPVSVGGTVWLKGRLY
ncbi:hypothetical protein OG436_29470 [Streptomyces caniferus]|uniref:hypothetical protein n=1 Tax=Streptomyces caniferus TaxID=285557 RepID=UPI002E2D0753|nr:hypothetical protein [Streptomyces caniferus]